MVVSDAPVRTLIARADEEYDLMILGETRPTLRERIVGETPRRIAERSLEPVLVVRRVDGGERSENDGERTESNTTDTDTDAVDDTDYM